LEEKVDDYVVHFTAVEITEVDDERACVAARLHRVAAGIHLVLVYYLGVAWLFPRR
jgi:hypothetical protein